MAAHPMHACARGSGRRAEVEPGHRSGVGAPTEGRPDKELPECVRTPGDVAPDEVGVVVLEVCRRACRACQDTLAEAGREALDLSLDTLAHIERRSVRDMAIGPRGVFAWGSARCVEETLLREHDERPLGVPPFPGATLRVCDLSQRSANVNGAGLCDLGRPPWDRSVQRIVELECARPVLPVLEPAAVPVRQFIACERKELLRGHVAEHEPAARQLTQRRDVVVRLDLSSKGSEPRGESFRDRL